MIKTTNPRAGTHTALLLNEELLLLENIADLHKFLSFSKGISGLDLTRWAQTRSIAFKQMGAVGWVLTVVKEGEVMVKDRKTEAVKVYSLRDFEALYDEYPSRGEMIERELRSYLTKFFAEEMSKDRSLRDVVFCLLGELYRDRRASADARKLEELVRGNNENRRKTTISVEGMEPKDLTLETKETGVAYFKDVEGRIFPVPVKRSGSHTYTLDAERLNAPGWVEEAAALVAREVAKGNPLYSEPEPLHGYREDAPQSVNLGVPNPLRAGNEGGML